MNSTQHSLHSHYLRGDQIMCGINWLLFLLALALASWHDTWTQALVIGLPATLVPTALYFMMPGSTLTRLANAMAFMIATALHIHQSHGMIEMHFGVFVLLAFLLYYYDWKPIVAGAATIAVHHLAFNLLQAGGYGVYVLPQANLGVIIIHAVYVIFESAILIVLANSFYKEALQATELDNISKHLKVQAGQVDLSYRADNAQSAIARDINDFMQTLHATVTSTREASRALAEAMSGMTTHSREADTSAQQQLHETDQVAAAINQMTSTVQDVARHAEIAAATSAEADSEVKAGTHTLNQTREQIINLANEVEQASGVIQQLANDSQSINMVLDVIKSIAEQTNLLALNAAIEAARAGEQGRGFAVVADEVRTLASRTQESTAEIQSMIEKLQIGTKNAVRAMEEGRNKAHIGVQHANKASDALLAISSMVDKIRDMNLQIANAAEEQNAVMGEINRNIHTISHLTDSNTARISQMAQTSSGLNQLSSQLDKLVGKFTL